MTKPFAGLRVLDLTQVVSGAVTTMFLADFGADVIKVEPPGGEPYRRAGHPIRTPAGETNLNILRFSRGKRSVVLDLKSEDGRAAFDELVATADVLVENFRAGTLARLGYPWAALHDRNPRLIYTSVSGFGHDGDVLPSTQGDQPTYAITAEAMAGLMHLAADRDGRPVWMGFAMTDIFSGALAFAGTLLALRERDRTGVGRRVDIAMFDAAVLMNDLAVAAYSVLGEVMGSGQYSLQAPWGPYAATDGWVCIAVLAERQWQALAQVIGRPDLATDSRLASGKDRAREHDDLVRPAIEQWTRQRSRAAAAAELSARGIPAAPVNDAADVVASPRLADRLMLRDTEDPVAGRFQTVGNPIKIDQHLPDPLPARIPALGEHTEEVLDEVFGPTRPKTPPPSRARSA